MKVISVVSAKGGVGKTTLTANLATALHRLGVPTVLVVDLDPQNALGLHFGADPGALAGVSRASLSGDSWGSVCQQSPSGVHVLPYGVVNEADRVAFERHLEAHPDWLAQQLQNQGAHAIFAPVYERHAPRPTPAVCAQLQRWQQQPAWWLFSSSECLGHLADLAPHLSWQAHTALATHPRIAQQAQALGFGQVRTVRPTLDDVHRFIQSQS